MFNLEKIIDQIPNHKGKLIIFIRHAEKDLTAEITHDAHLMITQEGMQQTHVVGNYLKQQLGIISKIKTSPVKRCVQTAEIFATCFHQPAKSIHLSSILGDPGPYVVDDQAAVETFKQYNIYEVIHNQLSGKHLPGMRNIREGTQLLLNEVWSDIKEASAPILYITHDVILAAFIADLIKTHLDANQWIHYLKGFCVTYVENKLLMHLAGQSYEVNLRA